MAKFNVGDEITTEEQLADLPVGTILEMICKDDKRISAGVVRSRGLTRGTRLETIYGVVYQINFHNLLKSHAVTILKLPKREWKLGDVVRAAWDFESLPYGAVVVCDRPTNDVFQQWGKSYMSIGFDEELDYAEMERLHAPARIIHLPDKGETNDRA